MFFQTAGLMPITSCHPQIAILSCGNGHPGDSETTAMTLSLGESEAMDRGDGQDHQLGSGTAPTDRLA